MFKKYLTIAFAAIALSACTESVMDDINKNESDPAVDIVDAKFQLTDAIVSTAFSTYGGAYAWYVASYTEQVFGTGDNQLRNAELRNANETAASTTYNNEWNATYSNLMNIKQMLDKTEDGKINAGQKDVRGIANVLWVLNFEALTDLHGDIPYSQALQGQSNLQPDLDSQLDIYTDLVRRCDTAIADLDEAIENEDDNVGGQDILYGGNLSAWKALAYAVKARLLLNQSAVKADYNAVLSAATNALNAGFKEFAVGIFNGVDCDNPWSAYFWSRYYSASCKTVVDLMEEREDPRLDSYDIPAFSGKIPGTPGNEDHARSYRVLNISGWFNNGAQTQHVFSKSELYFIIAEAKARLGQDASSELRNAVSASIDDFAESDPYERTDIDAKDEYVASLKISLKEIMVQKYLAQSRDEQIQTYNDIRRCQALGEEFVKLTNPRNNQGGLNRWPLRLAYGNSDVISNPKVAAAFGNGSEAGAYVFTERCRIFGGNR